MYKKIVLLLAIASIGLMVLMPIASAQGPSTEMNTTIVGHDTSYGLYVTAPLNTSTDMIQNFTLVLRSPGASTYSITVNSNPYSSGHFDYLTVLYFNTTYSGQKTISITMYSSALNLTQTFTYDLVFLTTTEYISYMNTQSHPSTTGKYTITELATDVGIALGIFAILSALSTVEQFKSKIAKIMRAGAIRSG